MGWETKINAPDNYQVQIASSASNTAYASTIWLRNDGGVTRTVYFNHRYIQSSPPYKIGNVNWGHFLFLLRNISTGKIISSVEAEDPPWAYNGPPQNAKDSIERIQAIPHPFADYWGKDPAVNGLEIVLIDFGGYDTEKWIADNDKVGKSILDDMQGKVDPGAIILPATVGLPDIPGFTNVVKIRSRI